MFADSRLAARIDHAEANLTREVAASVAARGSESVLVHPLGGGVASFVRPRSPMNKLIGIGFDGPLDVDALETIEVAWHARSEPVRAEVSTLADPEVLIQLVGRGYRLIAFENVLGLSLTSWASSAPSSDIEVARAVQHERVAWRETSLTGFAHPDGTGAGVEQVTSEVVRKALDDFLEAPGFLCYLARIGGTVAGAATMRLDGMAQLCGAATLPALRRRGVQAALLMARLREAQAAGCDLATMTVAPGSQSQANAQRRGFELLYARAILVKSANFE